MTQCQPFPDPTPSRRRLPRGSRSRTWNLMLAAAATLLLAASPPNGAGSKDPSPNQRLRPGPLLDASRVVGATECAECHEDETRVWLTTAHVEGATALSRDAEAKAIAKALGVRRIKSDARCINCHYTPQQLEGGRIKATSGVSCESCHGAAAEWIEIHSDYGGATRDTETSEHRSTRLATCEQAAMNHPGAIGGLANQCYGCHLIADEELVEVGGHVAASDFELVAWSQGSVRHNFLRGEGANTPSDAARLRTMYVVGQATQLEHSLRALAGSKGNGPFAESMRAVATASLGRLSSVAERVELEGLRQLLDSIDLESCASDEGLSRASADRIHAALATLEASAGSVSLDALDELVPDASEFFGQARN